MRMPDPDSSSILSPHPNPSHFPYPLHTSPRSLIPLLHLRALPIPPHLALSFPPCRPLCPVLLHRRRHPSPPWPPLPEPTTETEISEDNNKRISNRSAKSSWKPDGSGYGSGLTRPDFLPEEEEKNGFLVNGNGSVSKFEKSEGKVVTEEAEWDEGDDELLKKLMGKHPVGKPGRWEAIAEGFKRRHSVESVIKRSKELGEKKVSDEDSYKRFLKDRKPVDRRIEGGNESNFGGLESVEVKKENSGWNSGVDLALLNALKAFPKDVAMRWEKIAAAVPGKTKAACMKRVAELKKDFRSSRAASSDAWIKDL